MLSLTLFMITFFSSLLSASLLFSAILFSFRFLKCGFAECAIRTQQLKEQILDSDLYSSFTLLLVPNITAFVNESTVNTTLFEWRQNHRVVFIDGKGRPYTPAATHSIFIQPSPPSASSVPSSSSTGSSHPASSSASGAANAEEKRVQFFAISDAFSLFSLFVDNGPLRHLSFLRHLLSVEDVKSSCKSAPASDHTFFQCREGDALIFDQNTLNVVRQKNSVSALTAPLPPLRAWPLASMSTAPSLVWLSSASTSSSVAPLMVSTSSSSSSPSGCPCGCTLPAAVIIHTINIPSKSNYEVKKEPRMMKMEKEGGERKTNQSL